MPIATVAQLKALLPGYSGTADDAALAVELARAEAELVAAAGWPSNDAGLKTFVSSTYTLFPTARDGRRLPLRLRAVTAVTSAHVAYDDVYDGSSLVPGADYLIDDRRALYLLSSSSWRWSTAYRANKVVVTAGWAEGGAPGDLEAAVLAQAKHRWATLRVAQDVAQMTIAGVSTSRLTGAAQAAVIAPQGITPIAYSMLQASEAYLWEAAIA